MSQRSDQVAEELRKIVSRILLEELNDPRMGFVTVTRVELTKDLRSAKIYYSVLGSDEDRESTREAIEENRVFIRRQAVERINMRYAIDMRFELDRSIDHSFKIDGILRKLKDEKEEGKQ